MPSKKGSSVPQIPNMVACTMCCDFPCRHELEGGRMEGRRTREYRPWNPLHRQTFHRPVRGTEFPIPKARVDYLTRYPRGIRCVLIRSSASTLAIGESPDPWHSRLPHKSASCESSISGLHPIVRFRYGPPVCSPPWLTEPAEHYVSARPQRLLRSNSLVQGRP